MLALMATGCSWIGVSSSKAPLLCTDTYQMPIIDTAVAAAAGGAFGALAYDNRGCKNDEHYCGYWVVYAVPLALIAIPYLISAATGYSSVYLCRDLPDANDDPHASRQRAALDEDWRLMNAAVVASRAGDCAKVQSLEQSTREADAGFHDSIFVADVGISRCLSHVSNRPSSGAATYCFDATTDNEPTTVCMQSEAGCKHAVEMLPAGIPVPTCVAREPAAGNVDAGQR